MLFLVVKGPQEENNICRNGSRKFILKPQIGHGLKCLLLSLALMLEIQPLY